MLLAKKLTKSANASRSYSKNKSDTFLLRRSVNTALRVGKRARGASLYHSRQCGIVLKPRLDCLDYTIVCFMTHDISSKLTNKYLCKLSVVQVQTNKIAQPCKNYFVFGPR